MNHLLEQQIHQGIRELVEESEKEAARKCATEILVFVGAYVPEKLKQEIAKRYSNPPIPTA